MVSFWILIVITTITNYISGMILFRERYSIHKMVITIILQSVLSALLIKSMPRFIVFSGVIGTIYLICDKKKSLGYSAVIGMLVQILIMMADVMLSNLVIAITKKDINNLLYDNEYNIWIYSIVTILIVIIFSIIISWIVNKKVKIKSLDFKNITNRLLVVMLLINFVIIFASGDICKSMGFNNEFIQSLGLLLCLYTIFLTIFLFMFVKNMVSEFDVKLEKEKNKQLSLYTKEIERLYNSIRNFKHDYRNILTSMSLYIADRDMDGLEEFFKKFVLPTDVMVNGSEFSIANLQYIEISELKAVLAIKQIEAKNRGIDCNIRILGAIKEVNMDIIDLVRIIGIIFDNAIESAETTESGKISCTVSQNQIFKLEIVNNYMGDVSDTSKFFEKGYTTKKEGLGIGLYNFVNIIHKYDNAIYSVFTQDNIFKIRITIS